MTWFVDRSLLDAEVKESEVVSEKITTAFADHPNRRQSEGSLRDLRQRVTFTIAAQVDDLDKVVKIVDELFSVLDRAQRA